MRNELVLLVKATRNTEGVRFRIVVGTRTWRGDSLSSVRLGGLVYRVINLDGRSSTDLRSLDNVLGLMVDLDRGTGVSGVKAISRWLQGHVARR